MSGFLGALVVVSTALGALGVLNEYRFWPWRSDFLKVADVAYSGRIAQIEERLLLIRLQIGECRKDPECDPDWLQTLEREKLDQQREILRLQTEQGTID